MDKTNTIKLTAGIIVLLSLIGTIYLVINQEKLYECNVDGETYVALCEEISESGTRCYYYENTTISKENCEGTYYFYEDGMCYKKRWKMCSTGWVKSKIKEVIGKEIKEIEIKPFTLKKDFTNKIQAEEYIVNLKSKANSEVTIGKTTIEPFSNDIKVYWSVCLFNQKEGIKTVCNETNMEFMECTDYSIEIREIIYEEEFYTKFISNVTLEEINNTIIKNANEVIEKYIPRMEIEIEI